MSHYIEKDNYIIIKKHFILFFFKFIKFIFLIIASLFIYWISKIYGDNISDGLKTINYIVFIFCFIIVNYAFIGLIIYIIEYYNDLIIISHEEIIFLKSSLILRDDLEIIDLYRIMSIDSYCHGLLANIFNFGEIVMEQQQLDNNENIKKIYFIPDPHKFIALIKEKKKIVHEERKKRYVVKNPTESNNIQDKIKKIITK